MSKEIECLRSAVFKGNAEKTQHFLSVVALTNEVRNLMQYAAAYGHIECLRSFVAVIGNDSKHIKEAVLAAANNGRTDCLKLLLPLCRSKKYKTLGLYGAVIGGHFDCVELLYDVEDPHFVLNTLIVHPHAPSYRHHTDRFQALIAQKEGEKIKAHLSDLSPSNQPRAASKL